MHDIQVARELATLREKIENLVEQWARNDSAATEGRRQMHADINNLTLRQGETKQQVENMTKKLNDEVMPVIKTVQQDRWRVEGMKSLSKIVWLSIGAFLSGMTWVLYTFLGIGKPPH